MIDACIRQRFDGIWEVVYEDKNGKRRRESCRTRDEQEADLFLARFKMEHDPDSPKPRRPKLGWLIDAYMHYQRGEKKAHNLKVLRGIAERLSERLGSVFWDELDQNHIDAYVTWRRSHKRWQNHHLAGRSEATVSDGTINKELRILRAIIKHSVHYKHIEREVTFKIKVSDSGTRDVWLTKDEVIRMLDRCEPEAIKDAEGMVEYRERDRSYLAGFILIALATAARREAILTLKWDQITFPEHVKGKQAIFGEGGAHEPIYIDFGAAMGNKRRPKVPVAGNSRLAAYLYFGTEGNTEYVITRNGKRIADVKKGLSTIASEASIKKKVTAHVLKHTSITWMVQSGMPLSSIADLVKSSEKILKRNYSHHRPDYAAQLAGATSV